MLGLLPSGLTRALGPSWRSIRSQGFAHFGSVATFLCVLRIALRFVNACCSCALLGASLLFTAAVNLRCAGSGFLGSSTLNACGSRLTRGPNELREVSGGVHAEVPGQRECRAMLAVGVCLHRAHGVLECGEKWFVAPQAHV